MMFLRFLCARLVLMEWAILVGLAFAITKKVYIFRANISGKILFASTDGWPTSCGFE